MKHQELNKVALEAMTEGLEDFEKWLEYQVDLNIDEKMLDKLWDVELKVVQRTKWKMVYGRCWSNIGKIEIYPNNFDTITLENFTDVVKHELAHHIAITVYGHMGRGHGMLWTRVCNAIGCTASATASH